MKNLLTGIAMAALLLSGCAKDAPQGGGGAEGDVSVIGFRPSTGKVKAADMDLVGLQTAGFKVLVANTKGDGSTDFTERFHTPFKYVVTPAAGESFWQLDGVTLADIHKWPTDAKYYPMSFYAYSPKALAGIALTNLTIIPTIAAKVGEQVDYLTATSTAGTMPTSGMQPLNFKHMLSKVQFNIATGDIYSAQVLALRVFNVGDAGRVYDIPTQKFGVEMPTDFDKNYDYVTHASTVQGFQGDADRLKSEDDAGALMLLPQVTAAWGKAAYKAAWDQYVLDLIDTPTLAWPTATATAALKTGAWVEVTYLMYETTGGKSIVGRYDAVSPENCRFVRVAYPLDLTTGAWNSAHQYTYTISLGTPGASGGTVLDPDTIKPDETPDPAVPIDPQDPGDNVVDTDKYIGFDVKVEAWGGNAGDVNIEAPVIP